MRRVVVTGMGAITPLAVSYTHLAKWTWFAIGYQCLLAYCVSLVINQVGSAIFYGVYTPWLIVAIALIVLFIWLLVRPYKEATTLNVKVKARA